MRRLLLYWRIILLSLLVPGYADGQAPLASVIEAGYVDGESVYYVLGCKHQGWKGYFALNNWFETIRSGDGGVDVTEAPNAMVAEGASDALLVVHTYGSTDYGLRITVPADGYLYFRLKKVGSFLSPRIRSTDTDISLLLNGQRVPLESSPNGSYYSPFLRAGTTFGIEFNKTEGEFHLEDISFYSNSSGVWVTNKDRSDGWTPSRVRPIDRPRLNQVYFNFNRPEEWPTIDMDGDLLTLDDQLKLDGSDGSLFTISYEDEIAVRSQQYWLRRRFVIREPCSGNQIEVERWWAPLPLIYNAESVR
ncbi:MAG: hypothetical protein AAFY91_17360 [Bacteroidota bacterium]